MLRCVPPVARAAPIAWALHRTGAARCIGRGAGGGNAGFAVRGLAASAAMSEEWEACPQEVPGGERAGDCFVERAGDTWRFDDYKWHDEGGGMTEADHDG